MQSDVPPLPISCLTDNLRLHRNSNIKAKCTIQDSSNNLFCKNNRITQILSNRKQLRPIIAGPSPYKNSARFNPPDTAKSSSKSVINQRVSSAKMLRIKQLQNQLADAHFHLNELSNENKLLKAIQKRQDTALKRYEGTNAELPRIINSHHEDLRVLQTKYKKLKSQYKDTCDTLKEKENELHSLQAQNKKLLQLSKDRHLGEREKLQNEVLDLNHRINQQDETIQTLKRKLALETKYLKHQLHAEMVKHKESQKQLQDTQLKLKSLEELTEQREKRSYQASRIMFFSKDKPHITSQSLTNLNDSRSENLIKGNSNFSFRRRRSEAITGQSLPALNGSFITNQPQETLQKISQETPLKLTETFMNFEQIRSFRHQKSPALNRTVPFSTSRGSVRDSPIKESQLEENYVTENQKDSDSVKKAYELPKTLKEEFGYSTDEDKCKNEEVFDNIKGENNTVNFTNRSRLLHARLVSSATEGVRTNKTQIINRSRSLTKENIENMEKIMENDKETRYDRDSVITVIARDMLKDDVDTNTNYSNSDLESEMEIPIAFNADEDENELRKSDVIIDQSEMEKQPNTSSHLSKFINQLYKPSNSSFDSNEDTKKSEVNISTVHEKVEFKTINGLVHAEMASEEIGKSDNLITKIQSQDVVKTSWIDDTITQDLLKDTVVIFDSDVTNNSKELEVKNQTEKLLNNNKQNSKQIKESEIDGKDYKSNGKRIHNNSKESNSKNKIEQKTASESSFDKATFDKAKLLAAMKAIDDNENIEYVEQKSRRNSSANRLQITENLYRGVPTHSKKKIDIMKELFADAKLDNNKSSKEN